MVSPDGITSQQDSNSPNQLSAPQENQSQSNNKDVHSDRYKGRTYLNDGQMQVKEYKMTNFGAEYQNSIIPYSNVQMNGNVNSNTQQVAPFDMKMYGSLRMNEMNNTSIQKKRKLSKLESGNKFSTRCNCRNSMCLQLYCECFMAGVYCSKECGCTDCMNNVFFEDSVYLAKQRIISKNPFAFAPKQVRQNEASSSRLGGCKCKQSMCRKNYCECFQAGVSCTEACGCQDCHNPHGTRQGCNHIAQQVSDNLSTALNNAILNLNSTYRIDQWEAPDLDDEPKFLYQLFYGKNNTPKFYRSLKNFLLLKQGMTKPQQQHMSIPSSMFAPQPCAGASMPSNKPSTLYSGQNDQTRGYNNIAQQVVNNVPSTLNNFTPDSNSLHRNEYVDAFDIEDETKALYKIFFPNNNNNNNNNNVTYHSLEKNLLQRQQMSDPQQLMPFLPSNFAPQPSVSKPSNQLPRHRNLPSHPSTSNSGQNDRA